MAENIGGVEILRDYALEERILEAVIADRNSVPRSQQLQVGPSEVGGCRELLRAGFFEPRTEAEPETAWAAAAHVGTVMGADLERILGQRIGALEQQRVTARFGMFGVEISGAIDLMFLDDDIVADLKSVADIGGLLFDLKRDASAIETLLSIRREGLLFNKNIETADGGYELTQTIIDKIAKLHYYVQLAIYVMGAMQQGILTENAEGRLIFYDRSGGYQDFIAVKMTPEMIALFFDIGQLRMGQVLQAQAAYNATGGNPAVIAPLRDKAPSYCFSAKVQCPRREHCWTGSDHTTAIMITDPEHVSAANRYDTGRSLEKLAVGMKNAARDELKNADVTGVLPDGKMLTFTGANRAISLVSTTAEKPVPQAILDKFLPPVDLQAEIEKELVEKPQVVARVQDQVTAATARPVERDMRWKVLAKMKLPEIRHLAGEVYGLERKGLKADVIERILDHEFDADGNRRQHQASTETASPVESAVSVEENAPPAEWTDEGDLTAQTGPEFADPEPEGSTFVAMVQPELDESAAQQRALMEAHQAAAAEDAAAFAADPRRTSPDPELTPEQIEARRMMGLDQPERDPRIDRVRFEPSEPEPEPAPMRTADEIRAEHVPETVPAAADEVLPNEDPERPGLFFDGMPERDRFRQMQYDSDPAMRARLLAVRVKFNGNTPASRKQ